LSACGVETPPGPGGANPSQPEPAPATTRAVATVQTLPDGGLGCPATITDPAGLTVPQPPSGIDGAARLLPDRPPTSMVVCAYPVLDLELGTGDTSSPPLGPPFRIARRTVATSTQRAQITELLAWAPRGGGPPGPCTLMIRNESVYLVGALYGADSTAAVWVAAKSDANVCSPATNGEFVARNGVGNVVESIVNGPDTDPLPSTDSVCSASLGRLGDDRSLAPQGAPRVTVCRPGRNSRIPTALDADQSAKVVAALRALSTSPSTHVCSPADGAQNSRQRAFRLVLRYPTGPPAEVDVDPGCRPEVIGSGLQADDASGVVKLIDQWSKPLPYLDPNGSVSSTGSGQGVATGTPEPPTGTAPAGPAPFTGFPPAGPAKGSPIEPPGIPSLTPSAPSQRP
ncbi:MAG: hypothetical protein ABIQ53_16280, partial [Terracoccus sp.]